MSEKMLHDERPATRIPSVQSSKHDLTLPRPTGMADEKRKQAPKETAEARQPDQRGAGAIRFTSYPQNEAAQNPATSENVQPHGDRTLTCTECDWTVSGKSEEELLGYMRSHARQAHGKNEFTSAELEQARRAIHRRAA